MNRLLTAQEVAELLSVPPSWVYAEARAGRIPHVRMGRYCRFARESIDEWSRDLERGPGRRRTV
jgi:excisionase family DNA binding protein